MLNKVWKIDLDIAKHILYVTTQLHRISNNPTVKQNYKIGGRMFCYYQVNDFLYMDTLFAIWQGHKSYHDNQCGQLFVTNKEFFYFITMKTESDAPKSLRAFAKISSALDDSVCDSTRVQKSKEVRHFLVSIRTAFFFVGRSHSMVYLCGDVCWPAQTCHS